MRPVKVVLCALLLAACSSSKQKLDLGGTCALNSDCQDGLLCKFGACHKACVKSIDCATGERCVQVDGVAVCQLVSEQACGTNYVCPAPFACMRADNSCRNTCSPTNDCLGGQVCTAGFCVEKSETVSGVDAGEGIPDAGTSQTSGKLDGSPGQEAGRADSRNDGPTSTSPGTTGACTEVDYAAAIPANFWWGDCSSDQRKATSKSLYMYCSNDSGSSPASLWPNPLAGGSYRVSTDFVANAIDGGAFHLVLTSSSPVGDKSLAGSQNDFFSLYGDLRGGYYGCNAAGKVGTGRPPAGKTVNLAIEVRNKLATLLIDGVTVGSAALTFGDKYVGLVGGEVEFTASNFKVCALQ